MSAALDYEATLRGITAYTDPGYSPHHPTPRQHAGLLLPHREVLYGGAAGGGKSDWLLMGALQYVHVPGYAALLLRRTFPQLTKPESLIPRSQEWLGGTDAKWSEKNSRWTFPSGAVLDFGHLQYENDKYNYQGAAYQYVGWDELTQFKLSQFQYLHSRTRRPKDASRALSAVPIRVRAGSNPGGVGHNWVKQRFLGKHRHPGRAFLPARLRDNPHIDQDEYILSMMELDPITRAQLLNGDWKARVAGGYFKREWVDFTDTLPSGAVSCRGWDLASTKAAPGKDPDYTVGARVWKKDDHYWVGPLVRGQYSPNGLNKVVLDASRMDGQPCKVRMEQEPGSGGKISVAHFVSLKGMAEFDVRGRPSTGSKLTRFSPFASQCEAGNVTFISGAWVPDCFDELEALQTDGSHAHDDQADAISLAYNELTKKPDQWGAANDAMEAAAA